MSNDTQPVGEKKTVVVAFGRSSHPPPRAPSRRLPALTLWDVAALLFYAVVSAALSYSLLTGW